MGVVGQPHRVPLPDLGWKGQWRPKILFESSSPRPPSLGLGCLRARALSRFWGVGAFSGVLLSGLGAWRCSRSPPTWAVSMGVGPKQPPEPPTCPRCHGNDSAHVDEEEREEKRGEEASRQEDGRGLLRVPPAGALTPLAGPQP